MGQLTKVTPDMIRVANNVTSTTVGNTTTGISLTFDESGVIVAASNVVQSIANTQLTGTITEAQIADGAVSNTKISAVDSSKLTGNVAAARITNALNAGGSAPIYACRAWVNFNGQTTPGTIRASGNVSSVARNGTGDYTVNFTNALSDADYAYSLSNASSSSWDSGYITTRFSSDTQSTTQLQIRTGFVDAAAGTQALINLSTICVLIFR
jgi:hypothetical protein